MWKSFIVIMEKFCLLNLWLFLLEGVLYRNYIVFFMLMFLLLKEDVVELIVCIGILLFFVRFEFG